MTNTIRNKNQWNHSTHHCPSIRPAARADLCTGRYWTTHSRAANHSDDPKKIQIDLFGKYKCVMKRNIVHISGKYIPINIELQFLFSASSQSSSFPSAQLLAAPRRYWVVTLQPGPRAVYIKELLEPDLISVKTELSISVGNIHIIHIKRGGGSSVDFTAVFKGKVTNKKKVPHQCTQHLQA